MNTTYHIQTTDADHRTLYFHGCYFGDPRGLWVADAAGAWRTSERTIAYKNAREFGGEVVATEVPAAATQQTRLQRAAAWARATF